MRLCSIYMPDCLKTPSLYFEKYSLQDDDNQEKDAIYVLLEAVASGEYNLAHIGSAVPAWISICSIPSG